MMRSRFLVLLAAGLLASCASAPAGEPVTWQQVSRLPRPAPDHRIAYGPEPQQFGELRLPEGRGPFPVAVFIHGGCWRAEYDVGHVASAAEALTRAGIATWSIEYRRIGDPGGGWPGTLLDAASATDHLRLVAAELPLDLGRVILMGHSAGGHLALWLAARGNLAEGSILHSTAPLPVRGVVALAGITDLVTYGAGSGSCNAAVSQLLGGTAEQLPDRYAEASPRALLPLGVPVRLVHGAADPIVPLAQAEAFASAARAAGDDVRVHLVARAGHFDVVAPATPAWRAVERAALDLIR